MSGYLVNSFYLCVVQRIEKSGEGLVSLASRKGRLTWVAISFYQNEHWEKRKAEHRAHATRKQGSSRASVKNKHGAEGLPQASSAPSIRHFQL